MSTSSSTLTLPSRIARKVSSKARRLKDLHPVVLWERLQPNRYFENPPLLDEQTSHIDARLKALGDVMNPAQRRIYESVAAKYSGKSVIDVGCGLGIGTMLPRSIFKRVLGVDLSPHSVLFAQKVYSFSDVQFKQVDLFDHDVQPEFDLIVCLEVIEHVPDYRGFLEGIRQLMRDDSTLVISTPNRNHPSRDTNRPHTRRHIREFRSGEFWQHLSEFFTPRAMYPVDFSAEVDPQSATCTPMVVECGTIGVERSV